MHLVAANPLHIDSLREGRHNTRHIPRGIEFSLTCAHSSEAPVRKSVLARTCTASFIVFFCLAATICSSAQTLTTLFTFDFTHGRDPSSSLVQGPTGNFYGLTYRGGQNDDGTAFEITPQGTLTDLYSFCAITNDCNGSSSGSNPTDALILGFDGNLYGLTFEGGPNTNLQFCQFGCGAVFKIAPGGTPTVIYSFCSQQNCTDGFQPDSLLQGADGNFYGTTESGGANTTNCVLVSNLCGTIFKLTPQGVLTTLYSFCSQYSNQNCPDGGSPQPGLVRATNGNFYGTTLFGGTGSSPNGVIFEITPSGNYSLLHTFHFPGQPSFAGMLQASDGNLYGTALFNGNKSSGSIYRMTLNGQFLTMYNFCKETACPDGSYPQGLARGNDGNIYGVTSQGGLNNNAECSTGCGTIFSFTPAGQFTSLYSFCSLAHCADGFAPTKPMTQGTDGKFYGTTASSEGTIFSFDVGLAPFVSFVRGAGSIGQTGGILGQGFTGTTSVSIHGIPADFTVVSNTYIRATVPVGATTGYVKVTTPSGTLTSNVPFRVTP